MSADREQLELLLRQIDEMRANVARMLGGDAANDAANDDDTEILQLAAERAAAMKRRRVGGV